MAALLRGVRLLFPIEESVFLSSRSDIIVDPKRFVRGLRRKPVKVLSFEDQAAKAPKQPLPSRPDALAAKQEVKGNSPAAPTRHPDRTDPANTRSETAKHPHFTITVDQVEGLRYERAFPGDKRLS